MRHNKEKLIETDTEDRQVSAIVLSANCAPIFLEFGGLNKTCLTAETACHSLDQAVKHANWENATDILIHGHAELIVEVHFDSSSDKFKKTPSEDIAYEMTLNHHFLNSNTDHFGLTGLGTIKIKGTSTTRMTLSLNSDFIHPTLLFPIFVISTTRTPGGEKKDYVFPIIVDKGAINMGNWVRVYDPELGVLILKDIDTTESAVAVHQTFATSLTSLVPKGIVCSIPDNATSTFRVHIGDAGKKRKEDDKLAGIDQYPLDIHLSGKCAAFDIEDFVDEKFLLNNTDMTNISKTAFVFPKVTLTRSNLKFAAKIGGQSSDLGNYLLAEFTSQKASLSVAALDRLKVSIAPRYHTEDVDDKLIRWDEMTWYVGHKDTEIENGGVTIKQSGQSSYAVAAVPRANVGISGEYTVKMEFDDQVRYVGCLYSGARSTVAFTSLALLVAVLLGF
ncbi:hypothetical protein BLNAU_4990 [Blattamonas nauphoetae]|uniref:Protein PBN1 n=1 Tax=Blattamonas nauphoetae TaxID=2049346 RepID=A0ABQ9Y8L6_9EUKA|nr:hypothetical protein BLNAU_4990 [Blattamonas nauphoetae]